ncbi:putative Na/K ATPase alpha 1 subunit [Aureobasidium subglaciale]|nr:putative Na/K ATPase alpha 1 subunit [Aureobasidium subglaciale]
MSSSFDQESSIEKGEMERVITTNERSRITFEPEDRLERRRRHSRQRSQSRDSISSIRSRAQSTSAAAGLPIEFRTLSFQVAHSQTINDVVSESKWRRKAAPKTKKTKTPFKKTPKAEDKRQNDAEHFEKLDFHILDADSVIHGLQSSSTLGLTAEYASTRLATDGKNMLPRRRQNYAKKLFEYVFGGFCSVLWVGVIIFFICWKPLGNPDPQAYNLGLAILVLIVIFLQACFSAFQDWSTGRTMNAILDLLPADALVIRAGQTTKVPSTDLVVGDIVKISIGNKVPADVRLLATSGDVRFDRSMLTGESDEIEGAVESTDKNFLESRNIGLMGTMVTNGSATGIVVLTGKDTCMGRISSAMAGAKEKPTLIQLEINRFVKIIVCLTVVLALAILLTWVGWLRRDHPAYMSTVAMLNNVMGCVVAFIPEGMPVAVALTLMMVARRMKSSNILPKGLSTVETLGCVNVICSDKTGTLTENKMVVTSVGFVDEQLTVTEALSKMETGDNTVLTELHRAAALCNDATFDPLSMELPVLDREVQGNATDGAVLKFAEVAHADSTKSLPDAHPRKYQIPFNSKNKWMLTLHDEVDENYESAPEKTKYLVYVKGAPDKLLPFATSYWSAKNSSVLPLDAAAKAQFSALQERLSRNAERVILLCQRHYSPVEALGTNAFGDEILENGIADLTIIGVLGITDPPRKETAPTVASCRRAGARFFMVTGDFGLTGAAIARNVGIFTHSGEPDTYETIAEGHTFVNDSEKGARVNNSLLLEGPSINKLTDEDWDIVCSYEEIVFARTTPEQKLRIVNELKDRDNVVAVTGDGVNDAPALKAADVGIAIAAGSDVALEASDLVLLDKFDSIVEAIRLGRLVFQNLQKSIIFLLPAGSFSEIWPVMLNVFFGVPLPLSSFLMIIICVFTDLFLSMSLVMEKEEFDLLELPPRNHKKDHLINMKIYGQAYLFIGVMETICAHAMFFLYYWRHARIPIRDLFFAFEGYSEGFHGYTQAELTHFNTVGQGVYFVTLVFLQMGNLLSVRSKRMSILQADPFRAERRNPWLLAGMVVSFAIAIFVTMVPGIQTIFGTATVPLEFWLIPIPLALGILIMDEIRKVLVRSFPNGVLAKIAW